VRMCWEVKQQEQQQHVIESQLYSGPLSDSKPMLTGGERVTCSSSAGSDWEKNTWRSRDKDDVSESKGIA